ncbi:Isoquinoline 1-oxidoreductase subunit [Sphingomonas xinjiangensis]|uniref:Isoquinoline 1-oxidoreductase subunit n=1 Tax=Sphingomonas xinjiangensis TaxID=643568 RepID=A0A840YTG6_9SPHN|nr:Isoquinoline 1-oxidoreductase subunit [Sphingomonas xinjiangensis]MBB5712955.1 hypothetical protein [Sphingomonas xinjiangensis]
MVVLGLAMIFRPQSMPTSQSLLAAQAQPRASALRRASSFASIEDPKTRSLALFQEAGRVIEHPRCMNCHPRSDRPTQTSAMRPHMPWVTRGPDNAGAPTLRCATCHRDVNFEASGVPGSPKWKLAPIEMAWQGETLGEICRQILDPSRSHMSRAQLLHHMTEDELVGWAWHPGGNREPAPGSQAEFGSLISAWLDTGAKCPA